MLDPTFTGGYEDYYSLEEMEREIKDNINSRDVRFIALDAQNFKQRLLREILIVRQQTVNKIIEECSV